MHEPFMRMWVDLIYWHLSQIINQLKFKTLRLLFSKSNQAQTEEDYSVAENTILLKVTLGLLTAVVNVCLFVLIFHV